MSILFVPSSVKVRRKSEGTNFNAILVTSLQFATNVFPFSSPCAHRNEASLSHTWISEDPCRDVCPSGHDVLNIQTGFQTSLSCSLSAHNPVYLRVMLEAPAEYAHELGQVCRAVVLLQEL